MFLVSGTKRSGTSMWMQVLGAAGLDVLGEPFSRGWGDGPMRAANPNGFYESTYRDGVFFGTNPHPITGKYLRAEDETDTIVKVFVPGVLRTELAFIDGVIANIRPWRDYEASIHRLAALQDEQRLATCPDDPPLEHLPAHLEWWSENFNLIRDHSARGYPLLTQSYDALLRDPQRYVERALSFVGGDDADVEAAVNAVRPSARTVQEARSQSVSDRIARVFDDLYDAIDSGGGLTTSLQRALVSTHQELQPEITRWRVERARSRLLRGEQPSRALMVAAEFV